VQGGDRGKTKRRKRESFYRRNKGDGNGRKDPWRSIVLQKKLGKASEKGANHNHRGTEKKKGTYSRGPHEGGRRCRKGHVGIKEGAEWHDFIRGVVLGGGGELRGATEETVLGPREKRGEWSRGKGGKRKERIRREARFQDKKAENKKESFFQSRPDGERAKPKNEDFSDGGKGGENDEVTAGYTALQKGGKVAKQKEGEKKSESSDKKSLGGGGCWGGWRGLERQSESGSLRGANAG